MIFMGEIGEARVDQQAGQLHVFQRGLLLFQPGVAASEAFNGCETMWPKPAKKGSDHQFLPPFEAAEDKKT